MFKKFIKNTLSSLIAIIMVLMSALPVMAADKTGVQIGEGAGNKLADASFKAYKVLEATKLTGKDSDGNSLYSYSVTPEWNEFFKDGANGYIFEGGEIKTADTKQAITGDTRSTNTNSTAAHKLAVTMEIYAAKKNLAGEEIKNKPDVKELEHGYYLIVETSTGENEYTGADGLKHKRVASKPMLLSLTDKDNTTISVTPKDSDTKLKKTTNGKANDSAMIGEDVPFKIETSFPVYSFEANKRLDLQSIKFELSDVFSAGLDFKKDSVTLKVGGQSKTLSDYATVSYDSNARTATITFKTDKIVESQGLPVELNYVATLNENAVRNNIGNDNTVTLTFNNNPNEKNSYKTLTDKTKTYTYDVIIHKYDVKDDPSKVKADDHSKETKLEGTEFGIYTDAGCNHPVNKNGKALKIIIGSDNCFKIQGIKAGTYYLKETKTKAGYGEISGPIEFTIVEGTDGAAKLTLGTTLSGLAIEHGDDFVPAKPYKLQFKVPNTKGIRVPETGATTKKLLMTVGAAAIILGLVILVAGISKGRNKKINSK